MEKGLAMRDSKETRSERWDGVADYRIRRSGRARQLMSCMGGTFHSLLYCSHCTHTDGDLPQYVDQQDHEQEAFSKISRFTMDKIFNKTCDTQRLIDISPSALSIFSHQEWRRRAVCGAGAWRHGGNKQASA